MHSFFEIRIVIIVTKEKDHTLWHPYHTHAKARIMSEIDTGTNEDRYGGHEGTNDNDDATNDEHEDDDGG